MSEKRSTVLITGSNRGIGLEFARQYAARGWRVIATARDPQSAPELAALARQYPANVVIERLDVADEAQIAALASKYRGQPIDVLLNNAGLLGEPERQSLADLDYATFVEVLRVNTFAPLAVARAFLDNVRASEQKKIVAITSGLSSMHNTQRFGGLYFYRISKAGLNMAMRTLQADTRAQGIKVGILAPGVVDTRLLRQSGYRGAALTPEESARTTIANIDRLDQS
ncbi:MAG: SDR family oxidoreductase, partial [Steroidobacteraceae bacterium]|nr:SDR family oxidoreductase [Steroidobacteraceae bacterium]MDW8258293.1 SDR family oxidoreductase [Gammaproteobacteria bacterium]